MKFTKNLAALGLAAALALSCAACGGGQTGGQDVPSGEAAVYSVDGGVLLDQDGLTITATGWTTDPTEGPEGSPVVGLEIRNDGEKDVCVGVKNGVVNGFMNDLRLIEFMMEDGEIYGASYDFSLTIPAGGGGTYALGMNPSTLSMAGITAVSGIELTFTLSEDEFSTPYYTAEPVTIAAGDAAEDVPLDELGTVAVDNDTLKLVFGEQDYDDYSGPIVTVFVENKTDRYLGVSAKSADADGNVCDEIYYSSLLSPGRRSAEQMAFRGPVREMKGIENLTVVFSLHEEADADSLGFGGKALEPVTVTYPPRVWGEYENGGLRLDIQPKYNDLITVETPEDDADGVLFSVAETASFEAGGRQDGAGELFRIARISEERLRELLCEDMSGVQVFAKDADGFAYLRYYPTDVRYARETVDEMRRDQDQWTMLTEWAEEVPGRLRDQNEKLENLYRGNTELDMYLARAAYQEGTVYTLTALEYGTLEPGGVDAVPYAEFLLDGGFFQTEYDEPPAGERIVLSFPEEDLRFEFFKTQGNLVQETRGEDVTFYETFLYNENLSFADVVQGWYNALAEQAGVREHDTAADAFAGVWSEKTAGRGEVRITPTLASDRFRVEAEWPESAFETVTWSMTARLTEENTLVYENGIRRELEFDEAGEGYITDEDSEVSGQFYLNDTGELCWHDDQTENGGDSVFVRTDSAA